MILKISVITPIYEGNGYIESYLKNMSEAAALFSDRHNCLEVVFVNDSPWIPIEYDNNLVDGFQLTIIENKKNFGIHKSRVNGLEHATGEYIIFLDQDDLLTAKSLRSLSSCAKGKDMVLGNGLFEKKETEELIFGNNMSQDFAAKHFAYKWIRDFIVSPGQCLIKKNKIPNYWKQHILKNNGTDDYLLWLLMFNDGMDVGCCYDVVYIHKYTGVNLSLDEKYMFNSTREMLSILHKNPDYNRKNLKLIKRRIYYKKVDRSKKLLFIKESLKNLDVLFVNVLYRILWRGCLIKKGD